MDGFSISEINQSIENFEKLTKSYRKGGLD